MSGAVLAAVALLVSFWSLYLTALRRPKIELDLVPHQTQRAFPGWTDDPPLHRAADVQVWIVLANTGPTGTFLETLGLDDSFTCHGARPCLFTRLEKSWPHLRAESGKAIEQPPISFERGENEPYRLASRLHFADDVKTGSEVAVRLRELEAVSVTVVWSYRRGKLLQPWKRETRSERETIRLSTDYLKFDAASRWRSMPDFHRYADALEGRAEVAADEADSGGEGTGG